MYNNYDPLEELERLKQEIMMLRNNDHHIALGHNGLRDQVQAIDNKQEQILVAMRLLEGQLKLIEARLNMWLETVRMK
jgi:2',3'-cyclic-nucleotide 2'-phosphodiesterase (5'-nucleotidase family)